LIATRNNVLAALLPYGTEPVDTPRTGTRALSLANLAGFLGGRQRWLGWNNDASLEMISATGFSEDTAVGACIDIDIGGSSSALTWFRTDSAVNQLLSAPVCDARKRRWAM
jgi:hypothetical protein